MIVVGLPKLILNDNVTPAGVSGENVRVVRADRNFGSLNLKLQTHGFAELRNIRLLREPRSEVSGLVRPKIPQVDRRKFAELFIHMGNLLNEEPAELTGLGVESKMNLVLAGSPGSNAAPWCNWQHA